MKGFAFLLLFFLAGCGSDPVPELHRRGKSTPAEYITNQLGAPLSTAKPVNLRKGEILAQAGFDWPEKKPREATLPCSESWEDALCFEGEVPLGIYEKPSGGGSWRFRHDGKNFHFKVTVEDDRIEVDPVRPYLADCVEIFLSGDSRLWSYWEIVAAPGCPIFVAHHQVNYYGIRVSQYRIAPEGLQCRAERTPGGFTVEGSFPLHALVSLSGPLPNSKTRLTLGAVRINHNEGKYSPFPLLYDGHNIFGHLRLLFAY